MPANRKLLCSLTFSCSSVCFFHSCLPFSIPVISTKGTSFGSHLPTLCTVSTQQFISLILSLQLTILWSFFPPAGPKVGLSTKPYRGCSVTMVLLFLHRDLQCMDACLFRICAVTVLLISSQCTFVIVSNPT